MTATLTAVSMASCTKCPKATNIRSDRECSSSKLSSSPNVTVGELTTTTTTVGVATPQFIKTTTSMTMNTITTTDAITMMMNTTIQTMSTLTDSVIEPIVYPIETKVVTKTEPIIDESVTKTEPLNGYWDGTFYCAIDMGYTSPPCGASGNQLISGYSVASDYFDYGTLLYIESDYISGTFRVDDCGVGNYNTIDFYFYDNSEVPYDLSQAGRVPITITVIN